VTPTAAPGPDGGPGPLRGRLLAAALRLVGAVPEGLLVAAAESAGELWYRASPRRAAQARANLGRVCEGLAAQGRATGLARRAATDPDALESLVRRCFRHAARYYVEVARGGTVTLEEALARVDIETPEAVHDALATGRPIVIVGMHFGAIELPVVVAVSIMGRRVTAPMETVSNPTLQAWFERTRGRIGVNIIPLKNARRTLMDTLRRGESVGLVNDRDITGTGIPTPFFGHPAPISPGVAMLAIEAGVPVYAASARRTRDGRYIGKLVLVPAPGEGTRRERVTALTTAIAGAFESLLADAPEQWWGAFHPIWPDLAVTDARQEPAP
jgi:KDO2-lipid IV(A) lauroyltransferase